MNKKYIVLIILFIIGYFILYYLNNTYYENNGIPIINIDLKDTNIKYINSHSKEKKYHNNKIVVLDGGKKVLKSKVTVKGRGNFTWNLEKKPYQITFDEKTSVLGLPKVKKYILLANMADSSLLKNDFSYSVASKMKLNYSFTGEFVDLYFDGDYVGNYYLTPKVSINKNVIDLKNKKAILMELDNSYYKNEKKKDVFISDRFKDHIVLKDSNSKHVYGDMKEFKKKYNKMEKAIEDKDYKKLKKLIDLDSFAKYYIISEFSQNFDSLRSSLFFYMDGYEDKIHIGPIWDCDLTYGLKPEYSNVMNKPIKDNMFVDEGGVSPLFYKLLKIKDFRKKVKKIWNEKGRDVYKKEIKLLDKKIKYLNKSGSYNNFYWHKTGFDSSTKRLVDWINKRYDYFDDYMEE